MVNSIDTLVTGWYLVLQDFPQRYTLSLFYKLGRVLSLSPELLLIFLSNLYSPLCVTKILKFMVFTFLENALNVGIFSHAPHHSKLAPSSCHHTLGKGKLLILPGSIISKIFFPQQQKEMEEAMICYMEIQSKNIKMTWKIRLLVFFNVQM